MNTTNGDLPSVPTNQTDNLIDNRPILTAAYAINLLLGLPSNSYILWLIVTGAGSGVASEFFALNMSVSEIIFCSLTVLYLLFLYGFQVALTYPATFFSGLILTSRPLFQCCICVERYLAVVHPVAFLKYRPLRYRVACSAVAWLMVLGSCALFMFVVQLFFIWYIYLAQFLVLFSVKLFCCLAVLRALKQPGPGEGGRERQGENQMKERAFRIILIILVSMVVTYVPLVVILPLGSVLSNDKFNLGLCICDFIVIMTGFVQPLLYLHRAGKLPCIRGP